ncbi:YeiH family putative sulfate export transporter [Clostridium sp. 19966]|uniref:YeiH family protein n=1 Tax=Clostridium sp. 19966 TaxID=2768166 RepID=UPI0028DDDB3A|nr:YeiH family protein [Clostridium sp. 19966]MDT8717594.1 YeiH family putative sulfate export transporter [Clostridium sp. 19966]
MSKIKYLAPGIAFSFVLAIPAWFLGKAFPIIGSPVIGILLGIILSFWSKPSFLNEGISYSSKKILQLAIIMLGFEMNLYTVFKIGGQSLIIILFTLTASFLTSYLVGKKLKLPRNTSTLIGVGTAICGGSAIAATAPVIKASDDDIAFSISTIFLFNIIAVFLFPFLGHLLGMGDNGFGLWAGTAINDTSSVVAAGYSYSNAAGNFATIVKLARTLFIIPITLILAVYTSKKTNSEKSYSLKKIFPWFVLGFLAASIINTSGIFPSSFTKIFAEAGKFCIVIAMCAVGLKTNVKQFKENGIKPIFLGLCSWAAVAITSLIVQNIIKIW